MNWISNFLSRYYRNVHLATIAALAMVFIYGHVAINGVVSNVFLTTFHYPFFKIKTTVTSLLSVSEENARLTEALVDASVELSMLQEDRLENRRLRTVLGFEPPPTYAMIPAKLVEISSGQIPISAVINRGLADSILVNQPVINEDGLIGRIVSVSEHFATVQLLTDPANRVASRVQRSRHMGISKYSVSKGMILDNFPVQGDISPGDLVVSSGLGGVYPSGLIIGSVLDVKREPDDPFCNITLLLTADFSSLDELFVLRPESE